jgi:hypothetical protein
MGMRVMQIGRMRVRMGERLALVQMAVFTGDRGFMRIRMVSVRVAVCILYARRSNEKAEWNAAGGSIVQQFR